MPELLDADYDKGMTKERKERECVCVCVCVCVQSNSRPAPEKAKAPCVLDITGVRAQRVGEGVPHDVCEKDLELLLGEVWAWCTSQRLYKNNAHLATSIAKLVLESAGHPLTLCIDESTTSSKYLLDGKLY